MLFVNLAVRFSGMPSWATTPLYDEPVVEEQDASAAADEAADT